MRGRWIPAGFLILGGLLACGPAIFPETPPLHTRLEGGDRAPCGPLWEEGAELALRGLYRTSGREAYLDVLHFFPDGSSCWARFFLLGRSMDLGTVPWDTPLYVEVGGRLSAGRWSSPGLWDLQVEHWTTLPLDGRAVREACREAVATHLSDLEALDWAALALPSYVTGTAGFRPDMEEFRHMEMHLVGGDDIRPLFLLEGRGPTLPPVRPLVERWVAVECVYDVDRGKVLELVATIRGEVHE